MEDFLLIGKWVAWKVGDDTQISIGKYPLFGVDNEFILPLHFFRNLNKLI